MASVFYRLCAVEITEFSVYFELPLKRYHDVSLIGEEIIPQPITAAAAPRQSTSHLIHHFPVWYFVRQLP